MSLGSSKLVQPQRFGVVFSNIYAIVVHATKLYEGIIKALCSSQPKKRNRLGQILRNLAIYILPLTKYVLTVFAAQR